VNVRKPKPKPKLATVIPFVYRDRREPDDSRRAGESYALAIQEIQQSEGSTLTLEGAARVRGLIDTALKANHDVLYSWFVWENDEHTPQNIRWSEGARMRISYLVERYSAFRAVEAELRAPAPIFQLAEFRRVAQSARRRERQSLTMRKGAP